MKDISKGLTIIFEEESLVEKIQKIFLLEEQEQEIAFNKMLYSLDSDFIEKIITIIYLKDDGAKINSNDFIQDKIYGQKYYEYASCAIIKIMSLGEDKKKA